MMTMMMMMMVVVVTLTMGTNLGVDAMNAVSGHDAQIVPAACFPVQLASNYHITILWINTKYVVFIAICHTQHTYLQLIFH